MGMVSDLLLGCGRSCETHISAPGRLCVIMLLGVANAYTFMYYTNPASVWINMTALAFISELGSSVLDIARRGVFGHHIGKAITGLNFSLNFQTHYPWWFRWAHGVALTTMLVFVGCVAMFVFMVPDNMCTHVIHS